ncbi:FG-GAP-like repeat-containing protein [Myxococcus fulvus]|uniref:FG-GAP-like repeat-containing protein n=1 Tax=Myxococcus fulvus TaxID=33 RepID=UPI003B9C7F84
MGSGDAGLVADAGEGADEDAGPDTGDADASTDAGGGDASSDAGDVDASTDAGGGDASTDAGDVDASTDAGDVNPSTDAGSVDPSTDAGEIDGGANTDSGDVDASTDAGVGVIDAGGADAGPAADAGPGADAGNTPDGGAGDAGPTAEVPSAPTNVVATAAAGQASVTWSAPEDGGAPITSYTVTASPGGHSVTVSEPSAIVTGLQNGQPYTFTVRATNAVGDSASSEPSAPVTPSTVPDAPTEVLASISHSWVSVRWTAPAFDGGSALTGFTVSALDSEGVERATKVSDPSATEVLFDALIAGQPYTFVVRASNAHGDSAPSEPSEVMVPPVVPGAPESVVASAGVGSLTVEWWPPWWTGASEVTAYRVTPYRAGVAQTPITVGAQVRTVTFTGLPRATKYRATVVAVNALGESDASALSNEATTLDIPSEPLQLRAVALGSGRVRVSWAPPKTDGGSPITRFTVRVFPGEFTVTAEADATSVTVHGLETVRPYAFEVTATNAVGEGSPAHDEVVTWCGLGLGGWPIIGESSTSVMASDFDQDGLQGLVITQDEATGVLRGDGAGGFSLHGRVPTPANSRVGALADFNHDGHLDAALFNPSSGSDVTTITVVYGDAQGFTTRREFTVGTRPRALASADFNGDGHADLAVANAGSQDVSLLLGDGTGGFEPREALPFSDVIFSLDAGDLNGDGRGDLVVHYGSGTLRVLLGDADSGLSTWRNFGGSYNGGTVRLADVDGDGELDAVVTYASSPVVRVYPGDGAGGLRPPKTSALDGFASGMTLTDVNADGRLDLVVFNTAAAQVSVLVGDGMGRFAGRRDFATLARPSSVAAGDFNGDGRVDLALSNQGLANAMTVLRGDGSGGFSSRRDVPSGSKPTWTAAGDFNQDGRMDLAVTSEGSNSVGVMLGDGAGGFGARRDFATGRAPSVVLAVDLDKDGALDLVVANRDGSSSPSMAASVTVWIGTGGGGFVARNDYRTGLMPQAMVAGDFNGDGWMDIVTANTRDDTVTMLPGNGWGGFGAGQSTTTVFSPVSLASGDITGDGRLDLVVVGNTRGVQVLRNLGSGSFVEHSMMYMGGSPRGVALADFNKDGWLDVVVGNGGHSLADYHLQTFANHGGVLFRGDQLTAYRNPYHLVAGDYDGDGNVDLVVANHELPVNSASATLISVFPGLETGGFGGRRDFATGGRSTSLLSADLNADGRPDIVTTHTFDNTLGVLLNGCLD